MSHNTIDPITVPETYNQGKNPIYGIFVYNDLDFFAGEYLGFGDLPSEYSRVWIEILLYEAFGHNNTT